MRWFWKRGKLVILCFFFAKNVADNITPKEKKALKLLSNSWNKLTEKQIIELIELEEMVRINYEP